MTNQVETHFADRSEWSDGPWNVEPDRVDFKHAGLSCLVLRHPSLGHLCGYVAVPPGHPLHGVGFQDESPALAEALERRLEQPVGPNAGMGVLLAMLSGKADARPDVVLSVHGGLTYSKKCAGRICHVAQPGEPDDVWWFGFDCAHCDDASPTSRRMYGDGQYRTVEYVSGECRSLADQLAALVPS